MKQGVSESDVSGAMKISGVCFDFFYIASQDIY